VSRSGIRFDWLRAIGELVIIVAGVLIALAADEWNDDRIAAAGESRYVERIVADLDTDIRMLEFRLDALEQKEASLVRVAEQMRTGVVRDPSAFLQDIVIGANFGWNQGLAQRATYDELIGSGSFGLLREPGIRALVSDYYRDFSDKENRIEERETGYPDLTYALVPRALVVTDDGLVYERDVDPTLSAESIDRIVSEIFETELLPMVTAESNFGKFVRGVSLSLLDKSKSLRARLSDYRTTLD